MFSADLKGTGKHLTTDVLKMHRFPFDQTSGKWGWRVDLGGNKEGGKSQAQLEGEEMETFPGNASGVNLQRE